MTVSRFSAEVVDFVSVTHDVCCCLKNKFGLIAATYTVSKNCKRFVYPYPLQHTILVKNHSLRESKLWL
jgi:hypothetical protein